jgi:dipeptidyl aminopeptidase/acylaminoacyl peptidase
LYEKAASGAGDDRLLLQSNAGKFATSWSRDGQFILFENWAPQAKAGIWLMEVSASNRVRPVFQTNSFNQFQGQFSPDGHFIAYASDESGRAEVYVQRFPPSTDKWQISSGGGLQPLWRNDGKEIFFITEEGKLTAAEIRSGSGFETGIPKELFQTGFRTGFGSVYGYVVSKDGQRFLLTNPAQVENSSPLTIVLNWTAASSQR